MKKTFTLIALFALVTTIHLVGHTPSTATRLRQIMLSKYQNLPTAIFLFLIRGGRQATGHLIRVRLPNLCTSMWMVCKQKTTEGTKSSVLITKQAMAPR